MKKFSETQPVQDKEEREQIKAGQIIVLSGFIIQDSRKYPEGIAKINGNDMEGNVHKYWTTGKAIINQLLNMESSVGATDHIFKEKIAVKVVTEKSKTGQEYLSFADPS